MKKNATDPKTRIYLGENTGYEKISYEKSSKQNLANWRLFSLRV